MSYKLNRIRLATAAFCVASVAVAQAPTYIPKSGYVPDEKTAIAIAEAVLKPVYGEDQIRREEPFHAILKNDTWTVDGYTTDDVGGVATVHLSRTDGRIFYMMHGK